MITEAGTIEKPSKERASNPFEAMMEILICRPKLSSTYKCRKCSHLFTGGYGKIRCHFLPISKGVSGILDTGIRIIECTASTDPTVQPNRFLERQIISEFRRSESIAAGAKRARGTSIFWSYSTWSDSMCTKSTSKHGNWNRTYWFYHRLWPLTRHPKQTFISEFYKSSSTGGDVVWTTSSSCIRTEWVPPKYRTWGRERREN